MKIRKIIIPVICLLLLGVGIYAGNKYMDYLKSDAYILKQLNTAKAEVVKLNLPDTESQHTKLTFEGITAESNLNKILKILKKNNADAIFFLTAEEAQEFPEFVTTIRSAGYKLGALGLKAKDILSEEEVKEQVRRLNKTRRILAPSYMRLKDKDITDSTKKIVDVLDKELIGTNGVLNYKSFETQKDAYNYLTKLNYGDVITVKLNGFITEAELNETVTNLRPKPADDLNTNATGFTKQVNIDNLYNVVDWLTSSINYEVPTPAEIKVKEQNKDKKADYITQIYSTTRKNGLAFGNLGTKEELENILAGLDTSKGTFYLTLKDLEQTELVQMILNSDNEVGLMFPSDQAYNFYTAYRYIEDWQKLYTKNYKNTKMIKTAMPQWGTLVDVQLEALNCFNIQGVKPNINLQTDTTQELSNAKEIVALLSPKRRLSTRLADTIYIRLGFYTKDNTAADLVAYLKTEITNNKLITVSNNIKEDENTYKLNTGKKQTEIAINKYEDVDHLAKLKTEAFLGNYHATEPDKLIGISSDVASKLDREGLLKTDKRTFFLNFDDWGDDRYILELLDVLAKHQAKASFFLATHNIEDNPNLVRYIAEQGHEVSSHTDAHISVEDIKDEEGKRRELTEKEYEEFVKDFVLSYTKLYNILHDVKDSKLTKYIRPPKLAITNNQAKAIYTSGFSHILLGSLTSGDYEAKDAEELVDQLKEASKKSGATAIMHIDSRPLHTIEAVDKFLAFNAKQPDDKKVVPSLYSDYLE